MENGLPVTVTVSIALHAGAIGGWIYLNQVAQKAPMRVISNVELLVPVRQAAPAPSPKAPTPPSTWNFLKMALPTVQRSAPLQIKAPEIERRRQIEMPKMLEERANRLQKSQVQALDLERKRPNMANIDAMKLDAAPRRRSAVLDNIPKLEEVGTRRASKAAIEMAALEERRGRLQAQGIESALPDRSRRAALAQAALPEEAQPQGGKLSKMAEMLTSEPLPLQGRVRAAGLPSLDAMTDPAPARKEAPRAVTDDKKAMEIEGPLSNRKVISYSIPEFPQWAVERGLRQAEVRIRFYVNSAGSVLSDGMRVEATSGHPRLDRLAMDTLKTWRFQKQAGAGNQWGIITFRFVLE